MCPISLKPFEKTFSLELTKKEKSVRNIETYEQPTKLRVVQYAGEGTLFIVIINSL